jgi:hypothetical protein
MGLGLSPCHIGDSRATNRLRQGTANEKQS